MQIFVLKIDLFLNGSEFHQKLIGTNIMVLADMQIMVYLGILVTRKFFSRQKISRIYTALFWLFSPMQVVAVQMGLQVDKAIWISSEIVPWAI